MTFMIDRKMVEEIYEKRNRTYKPKPSFKEHQEFMLDCNRAMWKQFIKRIKDNNQ